MAVNVVGANTDLMTMHFFPVLARANTYYENQDPGALPLLLAGIMLYDAYPASEKTDKTAKGVSMACVQLGDCLRADRKDDLALEAYINACDYDPLNTTAWYYCGMVCMENGRNEEAIGYYQHIIDNHLEQNQEISYALVWFQIGYCFDELKDYRRAIDAYKRAMRANPDDFDTYYNLGKAYFNLRMWQDVLDIYQETTRRFNSIPAKQRRVIEIRVQQSKDALAGQAVAKG